MSHAYASSEPAFRSATMAASSARAPIALTKSPKLVAPAVKRKPYDSVILSPAELHRSKAQA